MRSSTTFEPDPQRRKLFFAAIQWYVSDRKKGIVGRHPSSYLWPAQLKYEIFTYDEDVKTGMTMIASNFRTWRFRNKAMIARLSK